jgi:hypothetical protein
MAAQARAIKAEKAFDAARALLRCRGTIMTATAELVGRLRGIVSRPDSLASLLNRNAQREAATTIESLATALEEAEEVAKAEAHARDFYAGLYCATADRLWFDHRFC